MNQSLKSLLALIILISLGASVLGWTTRGIGGFPESRFWLRASGIILVPAIALLVWADFRRDQAPDFLRKQAKAYFEQDGFCFAILPWATDGRFAWKVFFQNRFERPCKALVAFRPAPGILGVGRPNLGEVRVELECDGGAFGCAEIPYSIDPRYQGKNQKFELMAAARFPEGKGKMLRYRDGLPVGKRHHSGLDTAVTALSVLALHPHFSHAATFKLKLPAGVAAEAVGEVKQQILWRPGDPELRAHQLRASTLYSARYRDEPAKGRCHGLSFSLGCRRPGSARRYSLNDTRWIPNRRNLKRPAHRGSGAARLHDILRFHVRLRRLTRREGDARV